MVGWLPGWLTGQPASQLLLQSIFHISCIRYFKSMRFPNSHLEFFEIRRQVMLVELLVDHANPT